LVIAQYSLRLRQDQPQEIEIASSIRENAISLREKVSTGSYGDEELKKFWSIIERTQSGLMVSNPQLAERAGLGSQFFSSVARERRRPKLSNFLKALTAIIDVATERLSDIERANPDARPVFVTKAPELALLANSLAQIAKKEIERLDLEKPNQPQLLELHYKQRSLMALFADGFQKIADALSALHQKPTEPILLGNASEVLNQLAIGITTWWNKHSSELIDSGVRIPLMGAGIALLNLAGANMLIGTTAIAAIVGGEKVLKAIKSA